MATERQPLVTSSTQSLNQPTSVKDKIYLLYILLLLMSIRMSNLMDRFMLPVCTSFMASEIGYGDQVCQADVTSDSDVDPCAAFTEQETCLNGSDVTCDWVYTGGGKQYGFLVGPLYGVTYTTCGLAIGVLANSWNRKNLLTFCIILWSVGTMLIGAATQYWHLLLFNFIVGLGEGGSVPLAVSLISDYFSSRDRGIALAVCGVGIYSGIGIAVAFGNLIVVADIMGQGWRWAFYISGSIGLPLAMLLGITVKEPPREKEPEVRGQTTDDACRFCQWFWRYFAKTWRVVLCDPPVLLFVLGACVRNASNTLWSSYSEVYFLAAGDSPTEIASYFSWVLIVGGCSSTILGGLTADRLNIRYGVMGVLGLIAATTLVAAPLCAGSLLAPQPAAYLVLLVSYMFGEAWVTVGGVAFIGLVPPDVRTSALALYTFGMGNVASMATMLVSPVQHLFERSVDVYAITLRDTLLVLWPGMISLAGCLFLASMVTTWLNGTSPSATNTLGYGQLQG